jgi:site-specific DNA-methyltransferase (adenine-specific)
MKKEQIGNATLYCADCKDVLPLLEDIDSCVTDPPYGLSFMGKRWDYDVPSVDIWTQVHDVLKPGSHLLSFFGSRTYHRGTIPIEDSGFEIRDQLMWLYGSGFPKSLNIGKAVDKLQGNEREVVGKRKAHDIRGGAMMEATVSELKKEKSQIDIEITKGNSEWEGWGTALKPAHEPIVMARKPLAGTVAQTVLDHGTGGINIDDCRVGSEVRTNSGMSSLGVMHDDNWQPKKIETTAIGRYPANVMHDGSDLVQDIFEDKARYFYCAKANKKDRDEGNEHPTVKPTELMRYLCRLVTPKGGVVLDPFMGSGSTGKAAVMSGFKFVGIEMNEEYFEIACARIKKAQEQKKLF